MADWRLDQKTEETPQGTDLSLLVRGTSVFKTTFQKIKDFIIGTTSMGTEATDVTGAIKEVNDKVGDINVENDGDVASQLNAMTNNIFKSIENLNGKTVKFLGDSIGAGVGCTGFATDGEQIGNTGKKANNKGVSWINLLREDLKNKYNCTTYNWSVSGWKSTDIVNNINSLILNSDDIIVCAVGANNCYLTNGISTLIKDIETIYNYCKNKNITLIFVGTIQTETCANETQGIKMEDINNTIREFCSRNNAYFVPTFKMWEEYLIYSNMNKKLFYHDEEHPNDYGQRAMYFLISNYLGIHTNLETREKLYKLYDTGWVKLPLENGIVIDEEPQYRRKGTTVYIRGSVKNITAKDTFIGTLPTELAPSNRNHYYTNIIQYGHIGAFQVCVNTGKIKFQRAECLDSDLTSDMFIVLDTQYSLY